MLFSLLMTYTAFSQNITVESFMLLPTDRSATTGVNMKFDEDYRVMSVIKVEASGVRNIVFDGGFLGGILETEDKPDGTWVWVPAGTRKITISLEGYNPLRDYDFNGVEIEEGKTYVMRLGIPQKQKQEVPQRLCTMNVTSDTNGDDVFINDSLVGITPINLTLKPGFYIVKVVHEEYEDQQNVYIDKEAYKPLDFKFTKSIQITTSKNGDVVKIDGKRKGITPYNSTLPYGKHIVRVEGRDGKYNEEELVIEPTSPDRNEVYLELFTPQYHFTSKSLVFATANVGVGFLDYDVDNGHVETYLQKSYGFTIGSVKKVGWYVSVMSNFNFKAFNADYVSEGAYYYDDNYGYFYGDYVDGNYPFFSGESCGSRLSLMGGLLFKMGSLACFRVGAGYGHRAFAYSDLDGKWIRPTRYDKKGFDVALGLQFNNRNKFVLSFDVVSTNFSTVEARVGLGVCLHQEKVFKK